MSDIFMSLTIHTYNKIYNEANYPDNALSLYMFYYKNAKYQKTNQPWSTKVFCMKGLGWSESKFKRAKRDLIKLKLIERIPAYGQKTKEYVRINFMATAKTRAEVFTQDDKKLGGQKDAPQNYGPQMLKGSKVKCLKDSKEFTKVNSPTSGHHNKTLGIKQVLEKSKRAKLNIDIDIDIENIKIEQLRKEKQKRKKLKIKKEKINKNGYRYLDKATIELIEYWNSFDSLTTHRLKRKRNVSPLHTQNKTIKEIETSLNKLRSGIFYSKIDNIQKGLKTKKYTVEEIKESIGRIAKASSPEYSRNPKRISFTQFLFNPYAKFSTGKNKYRYSCPFLHFINHKPEKVYDAPTRKNTEYPILVDRTIKKLTGTIKLTDRQYNQVVNQIEKAMVFIKKISNGNLAENRMKLPMLLYDSMMDNRLDLTVEQLPLGVYNLEKLMRKRLMIK